MANPHRDTNYVARFTAPEFTTAQNKLIPDPLTYSDWFAQTDVEHRKMAVGVRRYNTVADRLQTTPTWADFVDPETGGLLSWQELGTEAEEDRRERVGDVLSLFADLRLNLARVLQFTSV